MTSDIDVQRDMWMSQQLGGNTCYTIPPAIVLSITLHRFAVSNLQSQQYHVAHAIFVEYCELRQMSCCGGALALG